MTDEVQNEMQTANRTSNEELDEEQMLDLAAEIISKW
jgi:hypothetical protein